MKTNINLNKVIKQINKAICGTVVAVSVTASPFLTAATAPVYAYTHKDASNAVSHALSVLDIMYIDEIDYKKLADSAISAIMDELDKYTQYLTVDEYKELYGVGQAGHTGIGIVMRLNGDGYPEVREVYPNSPAEKAGIKVGDIFTEVDGVNIKDKPLAEVRNLLYSEKNSSSVVKILNGGAYRQIKVIMGEYLIPTALTRKISGLISGANDGETAYIQINTFISVDDRPDIDTAAIFEKLYNDAKKSGAKNLIIDLRDNTGGDLKATVEIAEMLVKKGVICATIDNVGNRYVFESDKKEIDFNVAVLVNGETASSSEILASAIQQSGSGIIVGTTTYGKGVGQVTVPARDKDRVLKISALKVETRNGGTINGIGVEPDIKTEPEPFVIYGNTINADTDSKIIAQLSAALKFLGFMKDENNGEYNDALISAVKQFQKSENIEQTGVCDIETISIINRRAGDKYYKHDYALEAAYKALNS